MKNYVQMVKNELNRIGIKTTNLSQNSIAMTVSETNIPLLSIGMSFENGDIYDVTILAFIANVGNNIEDSLYVCNELNYTYKWLKFYVKDNTISCTLTTSFSDDTFLSEAMASLQMFIEIIDDNYKKILLSTLD